MRPTNGVAVLLAIAIGLSSPAARAQAPADGDKVTAEALFEEGRKLVADGKFADACPKFADSQRLDPSAATLLNLASCWERDGRTATAWATYREAASMADAAGRKEYVVAAQRHADALSPKLTRLSLNVAQWVEGIQIRRDGIVVGRAEWGSSLPVDPGTHTLTASAPGHKSWESSVEVPAAAGQVVSVTVPVLDVAPPEAAQASQSQPSSAIRSPMGPPTASPVTSPSLPTSEPKAQTQRIAAVVTGGLGVVAAAVGVGFAVAAKNKYDDSLSHCDAQHHNECDGEGLSQRSDARSSGDVATVAATIAAVAIAGGLVLWFTAPGVAPSKDEAHPVAVFLAPTLAGAVLGGTWQ